MNRTRIDYRNTQLPALKRGTASFGPCAGIFRAGDRRDGDTTID